MMINEDNIAYNSKTPDTNFEKLLSDAETINCLARTEADNLIKSKSAKKYNDFSELLKELKITYK